MCFVFVSDLAWFSGIAYEIWDVICVVESGWFDLLPWSMFVFVCVFCVCSYVFVFVGRSVCVCSCTCVR